MKTIGIIGGLGPESTVDYYREIIKAFNTRHTDLAYPEIIVYSANLNAFMPLVEAGRWERMTDWLLARLHSLQRAGADFAAIASNTPHIVFDAVSEASPIPLISIVAATCREAETMGVKKVGLMGTRLTMAADFYKKPFTSRGIAVAVPTAAEQELIHHRLFSEIELGVFKDQTREELLAIAGRMSAEEGIEALVLGCTELPLILTESRFGIPFLNTTAIHCERIIQTWLDG